MDPSQPAPTKPRPRPGGSLGVAGITLAALILFSATGLVVQAAHERQILERPVPEDSTFGRGELAVDGDTLIRGDEDADNPSGPAGGRQGGAFVFTLREGNWSPTASLFASDGATNDDFGLGLALEGDTAAVGAPGADVGDGRDQGAVYVFEREDGSWSQVSKIVAPTPERAMSFGGAVAMENDHLFIAAPREDDLDPSMPIPAELGAVYVYQREDRKWSQQAKIAPDGRESGDSFGRSIDAEGDTLVVGAFGEDRGRGAAYVFQRSDEGWVRQARLVQPTRQDSAFFGAAVALDRGRLIVGAEGFDPDHSEQGADHTGGAGAAYVFEASTEGWEPVAHLRPSGADPQGRFGEDVALRGEGAAVGGHRGHFAEKGNETVGSASLYRAGAEGWSLQARLDGSTDANTSGFGSRVALHRTSLVVADREGYVHVADLHTPLPEATADEGSGEGSGDRPLPAPGGLLSVLSVGLAAIFFAIRRRSN